MLVSSAMKFACLDGCPCTLVLHGASMSFKRSPAKFLTTASSCEMELSDKIISFRLVVLGMR